MLEAYLNSLVLEQEIIVLVIFYNDINGTRVLYEHQHDKTFHFTS